MKYLIILLSFLFVSSVYAEPPSNPVKSFGTAKKHTLKIFQDHRITFYCRCDYSAEKSIDPNSCGYKPKNPLTKKGKINVRATRIEWEHVVPANVFAKKLNCGSRKKCHKESKEFRLMEADLYNLVPAVGELNADRSNEPYGMIEGESREYGHCDFESTKKVTEPAPFIRGDIARIWLYMNETYELNISAEQVEMFTEWDKEDPVSMWELERQERIEVIQGNTYITQSEDQ